MQSMQCARRWRAGLPRATCAPGGRQRCLPACAVLSRWACQQWCTSLDDRDAKLCQQAASCLSTADSRSSRLQCCLPCWRAVAQAHLHSLPWSRAAGEHPGRVQRHAARHATTAGGGIPGAAGLGGEPRTLDCPAPHSQPAGCVPYRLPQQQAAAHCPSAVWPSTHLKQPGQVTKPVCQVLVSA